MDIAKYAVWGVVRLYVNGLDALVRAKPLIRQRVQRPVGPITLDESADLLRQRTVLGKPQAVAVRSQRFRKNRQLRLPGNGQLGQRQVRDHRVQQPALQRQQLGGKSS